MDCKVDTIKSNTSRIKQYLGKEAQPLCESIEMKINEGIPENEAKVFVEKKTEKTTREKQAYAVWLLIVRL